MFGARAIGPIRAKCGWRCTASGPAIWAAGPKSSFRFCSWCTAHRCRSSSFDLDVAGDEYSMMDVLARDGFDVWIMDHEGFGRSSQTSGTSDIASRVEDLKAAMRTVQQATGRSKVHMFGESSGAIAAAAFAQAEPDRIDRLILAAFTYKGEGAAEIARRRARIEELRANPRRKRDAGMIRSIFTRDGHPSLYDPAMIEALVAAEMPHGESVPSGTYVDMAVNLP